MKTINWGIIGCGAVTEIKSGPAFNKVSHSKLVAVMRRNKDKAKDYAERHNIPKWYDNADKLINDSEVNAVYIATPPDSHMEYTVKVAQAGKPVYVEKPMALNYKECLKMIEVCKNAQVPLYVAYYRRQLPAYLKVKELLENEAIGKVRCVKVTHYQPLDTLKGEQLPWRFLPEMSGGGNFVDMGAHTIDILDFIFGPIKEVAGFATNQAGLYPAEDIVSAIFSFDSGVQGSGTWCFDAFETYEVNEIIGNLGYITFSCFNENPVVLKNKKGTQHFFVKNPENIQLNLIRTVVGDLLGQMVCPSKGEDGARTTKVIDQILNSWRNRK